MSILVLLVRREEEAGSDLDGPHWEALWMDPTAINE